MYDIVLNSWLKQSCLGLLSNQDLLACVHTYHEETQAWGGEGTGQSPIAKRWQDSK